MDTDATLTARLAHDLDAAFPTLVETHQDRLYTIALRLLGDPRDAEEVAQDALVRAYRAMSAYPARRIAELRLRPWLAAITVNLARNRRRRLAERHPPVQLDPLLGAGFEPVEEQPGPASLATRRERIEELAETMLRLPPAIRIAVVLRHVDGLSVAETSEALGRPEGTVKAQVSRGLDRLRQLLDDSEAQASVTAHDTELSGSPPRPRTAAVDPAHTAAPPSTEGRAFAAAEVLR